jgi:hypothetical protein
MGSLLLQMWFEWLVIDQATWIHQIQLQLWIDHFHIFGETRISSISLAKVKWSLHSTLDDIEPLNDVKLSLDLLYIANITGSAFHYHIWTQSPD